MENSRVKEESVQKYFNALVELRNVLKYTSRISLDGFCKENNLSKNLPAVLKKGGIITCIKRGNHSEWTWNSIEPTKQMALKSIQMLGELNPPRKPRLKKPVVKEVVDKIINLENKDKKVCKCENKTFIFKLFGFKIYEKTTLIS